jgi:tetratricopeptide (TPR) repeat protein
MQLLKKVLNFSAERYLKTAGDLFIYHSDYHGALSLVEKALFHEPNDTRALVLYGDILFCLNRDLEALKALNDAISLNPDLAEAYISKAGVLEVMGKYREALLCCRQALTLIDQKKQYLLPSLFDQKIILLIRLKRFREAQLVLDNAANYLDEDDLDFLFSSYKGLLDQFCQKRQQATEKAKRLSLSVIKEDTTPQQQFS